MEYFVTMQSVESAAQLAKQPSRSPRLESLRRKTLPHGRAFNKLHRQVRRPGRGCAMAEESDNIGVQNCLERRDFLPEPPQKARIGQFSVENFDRAAPALQLIRPSKTLAKPPRARNRRGKKRPSRAVPINI